METVVSGIRSTGNLHLGNYFGAMKNFIKMQQEYNCYFFIADYHSLTTHPNPQNLHLHVKNVLVEYLAAGIDPEQSTIYVQSDLPEIAELYLLLNMNAYLGELERCTSFKDKIRNNTENINAGLLTYPVLMAADIIIHKATKVPVGKDQEQHLEMARTFANRFNRMYDTEYFPEPPNAAGLCFCLWINGMGGYLCLFEERVTLGNIYSPKAHVHIQAHMHESHAIISRTGPIMQIQPADEFCTVYINDQRLSRDGQVLQNSQKIRFDDWNPKFEFTWHQFEGSGPGGMLLPSESRRLQPGIERVILEVNRIAIGPETHCAIRTQAIDLKKTIYLVRENQHAVIVVPDGVDHLGARRLIATVGTQHMVGNLSFSLTHAYESNTINS